MTDAGPVGACRCPAVPPPAGLSVGFAHITAPEARPGARPGLTCPRRGRSARSGQQQHRHTKGAPSRTRDVFSPSLSLAPLMRYAFAAALRCAEACFEVLCRSWWSMFENRPITFGDVGHSDRKIAPSGERVVSLFRLQVDSGHVVCLERLE